MPEEENWHLMWPEALLFSMPTRCVSTTYLCCPGVKKEKFKKKRKQTEKKGEKLQSSESEVKLHSSIRKGHIQLRRSESESELRYIF
jgi:hypothetical protein